MHCYHWDMLMNLAPIVRAFHFGMAGLIAFAVLAIGQPASAQMQGIPTPPKGERFPVRNGAPAIREAYANADSWEGRSVSVEGAIKSVVIQNGRPSFELQLDSSPEITLWAMFPRPIGQGAEPQVGERVRAAGWIRKSEGWEKMVGSSLPRQNAMTLLTNCLVVLPSLEALVDPKFGQFCTA